MLSGVNDGYLGLGLSRPVALKGHRSGPDRLGAPEETPENVRPFFPMMGITRVADITGLDTIGFPIVLANEPNPRFIVVTQGKGLDLVASKASAVMESIEAYTAERIVKPLILGCVNDLRFSHPLADVNALVRTTASAYSPTFRVYEWKAVGYSLVRRSGSRTRWSTLRSRSLCRPGPGLSSVQRTDCPRVIASSKRSAMACATPLSGMPPRCIMCGQPKQPPRPGSTSARWTTRIVRNRWGGWTRTGMIVRAWGITTEIAIPAYKCIVAERDRDVRVPVVRVLIPAGISPTGSALPSRRAWPATPRPQGSAIGWRCAKRFGSNSGMPTATRPHRRVAQNDR